MTILTSDRSKLELTYGIYSLSNEDLNIVSQRPDLCRQMLLSATSFFVSLGSAFLCLPLHQKSYLIGWILGQEAGCWMSLTTRHCSSWATETSQVPQALRPSATKSLSRGEGCCRKLLAAECCCLLCAVEAGRWRHCEYCQNLGLEKPRMQQEPAEWAFLNWKQHFFSWNVSHAPSHKASGSTVRGNHIKGPYSVSSSRKTSESEAERQNIDKQHRSVAKPHCDFGAIILPKVCTSLIFFIFQISFLVG